MQDALAVVELDQLATANEAFGVLIVGMASESGTVRLPGSYVAEHVELAYAQTSHATQGRTVDRSILVLDRPTDLRGLYVPLTRGRHSDDAYIATTGEVDAVDVFRESMARSWIDQPAHARQSELADHRSRTIWPMATSRRH